MKRFQSTIHWKKAVNKLSSYTQLERVALMVFVILFAISIGLLLTSITKNSDPNGSPAYGGAFSEALVGQPQYINPLLSSSNDIDRDISSLIHSSLMKYSESGELEFDLAEDFTTQDFGKSYRFYLRKNVSWHDGEAFDADDVIFTVEAIQNPLYRSALSINWQGVTVSKIDSHTVEFNLKNVYAPFISNTTLSILPEHIWGTVDPADFREAVSTLTPVGTGPYTYDKVKNDTSGKVLEIILVANQNYYQKKSFINKLTFKFYDSEEDAKQDFLHSKVDAYAFLSADISSDVLERNDSRPIQPSLPRYFALFFNQQNVEALKSTTIRQGLAHAIDKNAIISQSLSGNGTVLDSPIPSHLIEARQDISQYDYDPSLSNQLLDEGDALDQDLNGIREYLDDELVLTISTPDLPELVRVAEQVGDMWRKVGVDSTINKISINDVIGKVVRTRDYEVLLFGQVLGHEPDPFSFWHSSQIKDPGLNLALYQNPQVDALLEEARQTLDQEVRDSKYKEFSNVLMNDIPAVFLYTPVFTYLVDKKIQGVHVSNINVPTERFANVSNWYINTK